jgi:hypothetical protein
MTDLIANHPKKIASLIKNNLGKKAAAAGAGGAGKSPSIDESVDLDMVLLLLYKVKSIL